MSKKIPTFFVCYISYSFLLGHGQQECYNGSTYPKKLASIPFVYLSANMYGHFLLSNFTKNIWAIYCTPSNPKISFVVCSTWALGPIKSRAGTIIPKLVCSMVLQV